MIGGLPPGIGAAIGAMILHTIEAAAAASLACLTLAVLCFIVSKRTAGNRSTLFRCLTMVFAALAFVPPAVVVIAVTR